MTDLYSDSGESKKKFLAPVVVMLLCMTSLTVAGYAYNSAITNDSEPFNPDYSVLIFTDNTGAEMTTKFAAATGFMITTDTNLPQNKVTINEDLGTVEISVYFKLVSDKTTQNYTIGSEFKLLNGEDVVTSVVVTDAIDGHKTVTFADPTIVYRNQADTEDAPATLAKGTVYLMKITLGATADVQFANKTPVEDAAAVVDAIDDLNFSVKLTATLA